MLLLSSKAKHMLGVCLAGRWKEVGVGRWGVNEDRCLYIIKDSEYSMVFGEGS